MADACPAAGGRGVNFHPARRVAPKGFRRAPGRRYNHPISVRPGHRRGAFSMAEWQRTHTCGELRDTHVGQAVVLNGWVNTLRSYNDQVFLDLRDRYGITQVVLEADNAELVAVGKQIGREFVLAVRGKVVARPGTMANPKLATGK